MPSRRADRLGILWREQEPSRTAVAARKLPADRRARDVTAAQEHTRSTVRTGGLPFAMIALLLISAFSARCAWSSGGGLAAPPGEPPPHRAGAGRRTSSARSGRRPGRVKFSAGLRRRRPGGTGPRPSAGVLGLDVRYRRCGDDVYRASRHRWSRTSSGWRSVGHGGRIVLASTPSGAVTSPPPRVDDAGRPRLGRDPAVHWESDQR